MLAGVLASALALAALWLVSRLDAAVPFAPLELAERVVRVTPGALATFTIEQLGKAALHLLAAGVTALLLAIGMLLARLSRGRIATVAVPGYAIVLALTSLSGPNRAGTAPVAVSVAVAAVAYGLALVASRASVGAATPVGDAPALRITRRRALLVTSGAVASLVGAGVVVGPIIKRAGERARRFALRAPDEPARAPSRGLLPALAGRPPEITAVAEHYVVDIDLVDPSLSAASWTLEVTGAVERPLRLAVAGLQRDFPLVEQVSVLTCISNEVGGPLVGNSRWTGVRLADLLRRAGPHSSADQLAFRCADGYTSALSLDDGLDPSVLVAIAQNGQPLTQAHGFPCRLRVPALYGMKNPKWLRSIEVRRSHLTADWVKRGWSDAAMVRTASRIDIAPDARIGQPVWIAGVAWAGDRRISAVELSFDEGATWRRARVQTPLSPLAWTQWAIRYTPTGGGVLTVACRAIDGDGRTQDARSRRPHPSGASGYHQVRLQVS